MATGIVQDKVLLDPTFKENPLMVAAQLGLADVNPGVAKIRLRIRGLRFDRHTPLMPQAQVRLGHRVYVTPKRPVDVPWLDVFEFELSLHEYLFWTLQIDLFESRRIFPRLHLGRAEIRLNKLERQCQGKTSTIQWYQLRRKRHSYSSLADLGVRDPILQEHVLGAICLEIRYWIGGRSTKEGDSSKPTPRPSSAPDPMLLIPRSSSLPTLLPSTIEAMAQDLTTRAEAADRSDAKSLNMECFEPPLMADMVQDENAEAVDFDDAESPAEAAMARQINSLLIRMSGWVFSDADFQVVEKIIKGAAGFGQGIEVSSVALGMAFLLVQRFHRSLPVPFSNNLVLKKTDLELPRIIYRFAFAAHGWAGLYAFGKRSDIISDAVSSQANYRAVMEYLQLEPQEMLVCDLDQNRLFRPNFYVAIDRRLSAVILSIRGTMSLRDTLIDLSCDYVAWNGGIAHSGMIAASKWFLENIGKQLLLFAKEYQLQRIILTGHSLGAGTAAITTIMLTEELKQAGTWPSTADGRPIDIHCYAYGCPPIVSADLAVRYSSIIDSFLFGDDIVPRLCYGTVIDLQILMVYAAEIGRTGDLMTAKEGSALFQKLETCRQAIQSGKGGVENMKLWIPGTVHHLMTIKAPNRRKYTVVDTCGGERFLEITLRKNMLRDHLPSRYEHAFEAAYVTYLLHELEERQTSPPLGVSNLQTKMKSVVDVVNTDSPLMDGSIFPRASTPAPSDDSLSVVDQLASLNI